MRVLLSNHLMAFESTSRRFEKHVDAKAGVVPVDISEKKSLKDIINSDESRQFSFYLESVKGGKALSSAWTNYLKGEPTEANEAVFQRHYDEYNERKEKGEKSFASIEKWTDDMLANSPVFKKLRDQKGGENVRYVIENGLRDMALSDPAGFAVIEREVSKLNALEARENALDKKMQEFCTKNDIPENTEIYEALRHPDEATRNYQLRRILQDNLNLHGRARAWDAVKSLFGGGTKAKARELSTENVARLIADRKRTTRAFGNYVSGILVKNKDFREALARAHVDKKPTFEKGSESKASLPELREKAKEFTKDGCIERAKVFRRENAHQNWRKKSERDRLVQEFCDKEKLHALTWKKELKKQGFLASIFSALLSFFSPKDSTGTLDPDIEKILNK